MSYEKGPECAVLIDLIPTMVAIFANKILLLLATIVGIVIDQLGVNLLINGRIKSAVHLSFLLFISPLIL